MFLVNLSLLLLLNGILCDPQSPNRLLYADLQKKINKYVLPVKDHMTPVNVSVGASLQTIDKIETDESGQMTAEMTLWLDLKWTDEFLYWNRSEYDGIGKIALPQDEIWKPDITLYNGRVEQLERHKLIITSEGIVSFLSPIKVFVSRFESVGPKKIVKMKFGS
ncbi:nAChRa5 (predicted) [Pycnogonum litorale]